MFQIRTQRPKRNKYYMTTDKGGWSLSVKGSPLISDANVLANCVGYANGRFAEIIASITGIEGIKYQFIPNAERFILVARRYGLEISQEPSIGSIMVWQQGTLKGHDGYGHVAIVERVLDRNAVLTSESGYKSFVFKNKLRCNYDNNWDMTKDFKFLGFIKNPVIK